MNLTVRKSTEMEKLKEKASIMSNIQLNKEVDRRLNGIMSKNINGSELVKLKKEASYLSNIILRKE